MEVNNANPKQPGCSLLLKSCLVITALVIGLFMAGMIYMIRMTSVRSIATCKENMLEVGAAVQRYKDVNGRRPMDLNTLRKDYLGNASVLRCPLDKTTGDAPSYAYNRRSTGAHVMLECDRHRLRKDMPVSKLVVRGDGTFDMVSPTLSEAFREAEKHSKKK